MRSTEPVIKPDSALHIYARAFLFLLPALLAWAFSTVYLLPKLTALWQNLTVGSPGVQGLFDFATGLITHFKVAFFTLVVALVLFEKYQPAWPRYRRQAVDAVTYVLNTAVIIALALLGVLSLGASAVTLSGKAQAAAPSPAAVTPSPTATSNTSPP